MLPLSYRVNLVWLKLQTDYIAVLIFVHCPFCMFLANSSVYSKSSALLNHVQVQGGCYHVCSIPVPRGAQCLIPLRLLVSFISVLALAPCRQLIVVPTLLTLLLHETGRSWVQMGFAWSHYYQSMMAVEYQKTCLCTTWSYDSPHTVRTHLCFPIQRPACKANILFFYVG